MTSTALPVERNHRKRDRFLDLVERRWVPDMRLGTLLSATLPFAIACYFAGVAITAGWVALDLPLGPGTSVEYHLPAR